LAHGRAQNRICVADDAGRQPAVDKPLACSLNLERSDGRQDISAKHGSDIPPEQALVTSIAFLTQFRFCSGIEPAIEKLIQRNLGSLESPAQVALAQHSREVFLGTAGGAVDGTVVITPSAGIALATEEYADEPALPATVDDLSETTRQ
jgi:hypothetical protein